jgi:hypothetical protein
MQRQALDRGLIFGKQVRDGPIAENVVAEGEAVAAEIAEAFARHKLIQGSRRLAGRIDRSRAGERLVRERPKDSRSVAVIYVVRTVGRLPPLCGHFDFRPRRRFRSGPRGQAASR